MTQATITFKGSGLQHFQTGHFTIAIEADIHVDAQTAQRKTTGWLISEVGNMLIAGQPQLVIGKQTIWRLPVLLTSIEQGTVGQVGFIDVDCETGELLITEETASNILSQVTHV